MSSNEYTTTPSGFSKEKNEGSTQKRVSGKKDNSSKSSNKFRGAVSKMNGKVFTLHSEGVRTGQFKETLEALIVLVAVEYKKEVLYLEPMFKDLKEPEIPLPKKPMPTKKEESDGTITHIPVMDVQEDIYKEEVKSYVAKKERLKSTTVAIYNIVWSQCSKLLKNKLKASKDFNDIEKESYVTKLLKLIRSISFQVEESVSIYALLIYSC